MGTALLAGLPGGDRQIRVGAIALGPVFALAAAVARRRWNGPSFDIGSFHVSGLRLITVSAEWLVRKQGITMSERKPKERTELAEIEQAQPAVEELTPDQAEAVRGATSPSPPNTQPNWRFRT